MKYFRWSEEECMNMTYEKFTMYLAAIPVYDSNKKDDDKNSSSTKGSAIIPEGLPTENAFGKITGVIQAWDLDKR